MRLLLLLCGLIYLSMVTTVTGSCDFPSRLWCSSGEIAKKCGVYEQCRRSAARSSSAGPVNVTLYFESLCPDCKVFIKEQLYKTWQTLGEDVMNLTMIPYGNAREKKVLDHWEFECQHGKEECVGNLIETCAINILQEKKKYMPFLYCIEKSDQMVTKAAEQCAEKLQIDLAPIVKCSNGKDGNTLEHQMAEVTDALNPPHKYVPWVTINGVHTEEIQREAQEDLLKLVCDTYKGVKPDACSRNLNLTRKQCYNI